MARNHYKPRKRRDKTTPASKEWQLEDRQPTRGESIRPATHGGYRHSFNYYEYTIQAKGAE